MIKLSCFAQQFSIFSKVENMSCKKSILQYQINIEMIWKIYILKCCFRKYEHFASKSYERL